MRGGDAAAVLAGMQQAALHPEEERAGVMTVIAASPPARGAEVPPVTGEIYGRHVPLLQRWKVRAVVQTLQGDSLQPRPQ